MEPLLPWCTLRMVLCAGNKDSAKFQKASDRLPVGAHMNTFRCQVGIPEFLIEVVACDRIQPVTHQPLGDKTP